MMLPNRDTCRSFAYHVRRNPWFALLLPLWLLGHTERGGRWAQTWWDRQVQRRRWLCRLGFHWPTFTIYTAPSVQRCDKCGAPVPVVDEQPA